MIGWIEVDLAPGTVGGAVTFEAETSDGRIDGTLRLAGAPKASDSTRTYEAYGPLFTAVDTDGASVVHRLRLTGLRRQEIVAVRVFRTVPALDLDAGFADDPDRPDCIRLTGRIRRIPPGATHIRFTYIGKSGVLLRSSVQRDELERHAPGVRSFSYCIRRAALHSLGIRAYTPIFLQVSAHHGAVEDASSMSAQSPGIVLRLP